MGGRCWTENEPERLLKPLSLCSDNWTATLGSPQRMALPQTLRSRLFSTSSTQQKSEAGVPKTILSGKTFSSNDDLIMSVLLFVFWSASSSGVRRRAVAPSMGAEGMGSNQVARRERLSAQRAPGAAQHDKKLSPPGALRRSEKLEVR